MTLAECIERLKVIQAMFNLSGYRAERETIAYITSVLERVDEPQLSQVIYDTCQKELNQTIGFSLTKSECDMFAHAIVEYILSGGEK